MYTHIHICTFLKLRELGLLSLSFKLSSGSSWSLTPQTSKKPKPKILQPES